MPLIPAQEVAVQTATRLVDLTPEDAAAVAVHIQSLDEGDRRLRYGVALLDPQAIQRNAQRMLCDPNVKSFGMWDSAHERLLVVGCYGRSATGPDAVEMGASALSEVRGGMSQRIADWLPPRLVAEGFQRIEWMFYADNKPVAAIAKKRGLNVICKQGECLAYIDLKPTADAIRDWLERLDLLLEAVRNEPAACLGAKL